MWRAEASAHRGRIVQPRAMPAFLTDTFDAQVSGKAGCGPNVTDKQMRNR
jgi:hypothetical protein